MQLLQMLFALGMAIFAALVATFWPEQTVTEDAACHDEWLGGTPTFGGSSRLLCHSEYVSLYDPENRIPIAVGQKLNREELRGNAQRNDVFSPDPLLPENESASLNDYKGSGYDRGHMAPSANFRFDQGAMDESFYLSNILPQTHENNAGPWLALEDAVRVCAKSLDQDLYVISGPLELSGKRLKGRVAVPSTLYKVVAIEQAGQIEVRTWIMPNNDRKRQPHFLIFERDFSEIAERGGPVLFPNVGNNVVSGKFCKGEFGS